jgi:ribosomal protein S18 acetylase RimI-like enzyme
MPDERGLPPLRDTDLRIREARSADLGALSELEASVFATDRLSRRRFAALMKSPSVSFMVAADGKAVVGYVLLLTRRGGRAARLYSLAVAPGSAGRGVGSRLLAAAETAALERGADALRLEVRRDNAGAIQFYERRGYQLIGRHEDYYEDGMTAVRYARALARPDDRAEPSSFGRAA